MPSTREQRKRYRLKHPEKVRENKIRYYDNKIKKRIARNKKYLDELNKRLTNQFHTLTRLMFKDQLPKVCFNCGTTIDLHIHHIVYTYPIQIEHLKVLCRKCHLEEHQRIPPPPSIG